jgi:hypothetical protein
VTETWLATLPAMARNTVSWCAFVKISPLRNRKLTDVRERSGKSNLGALGINHQVDLVSCQ